jgi:hypothetical protein
MTDPVYSRPMTSSGRSRIALLATALVLAVLAGNAPAQTPTPRVYNVEIIVFRNLSGTGGVEDWTARPVARGPDRPESPVTGRFVQSLPASAFKLGTVAARLRNSSNYQPIAHFAWQQTASSWGSRAGFTIAKLAGNVPGLSGIIYLESGQLLHLGMALEYSTSNPPAGLSAAPGTPFMLSESRRVKVDELQYYDHPAFGLVALVTPANRGTGGR